MRWPQSETCGSSSSRTPCALIRAARASRSWVVVSQSRCPIPFTPVAPLGEVVLAESELHPARLQHDPEQLSAVLPPLAHDETERLGVEPDAPAEVADGEPGATDRIRGVSALRASSVASGSGVGPAGRDGGPSSTWCLLAGWDGEYTARRLSLQRQAGTGPGPARAGRECRSGRPTGPPPRSGSGSPSRPPYGGGRWRPPRGREVRGTGLRSARRSADRRWRPPRRSDCVRPHRPRSRPRSSPATTEPTGSTGPRVWRSQRRRTWRPFGVDGHQGKPLIPMRAGPWRAAPPPPRRRGRTGGRAPGLRD